MKVEIYENNKEFMRSNFSLVAIKDDLKGSILKFKVLKELIAYWSHCIKIH